MERFASFQDFEQWLEGRDVFHIELGLGRMQNALARLRPRIAPVVQVLGTNGKGSTSAFLASLAQAHGLKTGLYSSPHLVNLGERIRVNGIPLDKDLLLQCANATYAAAPVLTWFEFVTVMAILAFQETGCELIVSEAGLGGANDATTAIPAIAHCFTPIAMDHARIIGPTLRHIAEDKARAIQPGAAVFSARQFPQATRVLEKYARSSGSEPLYSQPVPLPPGAFLTGAYQRINAGLAVTAWRATAPRLGITSSHAQEEAGLAAAWLPARLQHIRASADAGQMGAEPAAGHPEIYLDGAHNPHGMFALLRELEQLPRTESVIYSALADKDWQAGCAMLAATLPDADYYVVQLDNPRATSPGEIGQFIRKITRGHVEDCATLADALAQISRGPVLLTGSLYLCGEFFRLYPQYLEPPAPLTRT